MSHLLVWLAARHDPLPTNCVRGVSVGVQRDMVMWKHGGGLKGRGFLAHTVGREEIQISAQGDAFSTEGE